jgi:hypothetical protein
VAGHLAPGVSPALAGVAMGLLTPARPTAPPEVARDRGGALAGALAADPRPRACVRCCARPGGPWRWPSAWPTTSTR